MKKKMIVDDYPRPLARRNSFTSLNGKWDFYMDYLGEGNQKNFQNGFQKERDILVPFCYEAPASGIGEGKRCDDVWYQKEITYKKKDNKRLLLHLEGADYETSVYLNGEFVGRDSGAYHRETFELTSFLKMGKNLLVIHCHDDYSKEKPRGKQRWEDKNFGCWYLDTTGIYKTVWLEEVPSTYIEDFSISPDIKKKSVSLSLKTNGNEKLKRVVVVTYDDKEIARKESDSNEIEIKIPSPFHLWNVLSPEIYGLKISLYKNDELIDSLDSYFAFRHLETKNGKVYLNDKPLYQRLVLDQGYFKEGKLTPKNGEELLNDISLMMDIGFNGARKHQKIEDERFYYYADMLGYLTWGEMPSMYELTEKSKKTFEREYTLALHQLKNHPSIITWVPFNESWGIEDVGTNVETQAFVNHIVDLTKKLDPTRFCISNDGWEHTHSSLITIHDYEQNGEALKKKYPTAIEASTVHYEWRGKHAFVDNYSYKGEPMLLTEFGGTAFKCNYGGKNESWGYGEGVTSTEDFLNRLSLLVKSTVEIPFFEGFCYTQLSDVEQEVNGLVKEDRTYKLPKEALRKIFGMPRE